MKHLLLLACLLFVGIAQAQVSIGTVKDEFGNPVEEAYVLNAVSGLHAHTNAKGYFVVKTSPGDSVKIYRLGYATYTFTADNNNEPFEVVLREAAMDINQVVVTADMHALNQLMAIDVRLDPVNSSQDILRKVPGLFIGQHAGGGKAEQIFLRGFDIDHGTDINVKADGVPVNMVSHAHGQGYADLHFLIPETIEKIDFGKGPYYAQQGNFTTAGYVDLKTFDHLHQSKIVAEYGMFNTVRTVGLFSLTGKPQKHNAWVAGEYLATDGPFDAPQDFYRINFMGKYSGAINANQTLSFQASYFKSGWNASGQIPDRAVAQGLIGHFGAIDSTEGGLTSRINISMHHTNAIDDNTLVKTLAYFTQYDFELYSNFTFFLNDPLNGDQIKQKENRQMWGFESAMFRHFQTGNLNWMLSPGAGFRYDVVKDNELSNTRNRRQLINRVALGDVNELNMYAFLNAELEIGKLLINPAVRFEYFNFLYNNELDSVYNVRSAKRAILTPKLNFVWAPYRTLQVYLKSGIGFHSNDTRVAVPQNGREILPLALGSDLGVIWKPFDGMVVSAGLWYLYLQQEFVYVGDGGVVEPSGKTRRYGADLGLRYQIQSWLYFDGDINVTRPRAIGVPEAEARIPLAATLSTTGGLSVQHPSGFNAGLRYRWLGDRPANEDNSVVAKGYFLMDLNASYRFRNVTFSVSAENLLNTEWKETQFDTESRLFNEAAPVSEIHFTPGTPFMLKGGVTVAW